MNKKINNYKVWEQEAKKRDLDFWKALANNYQEEMKKHEIQQKSEWLINTSYGTNQDMIEDKGTFKNSNSYKQ